MAGFTFEVTTTGASETVDLSELTVSSQAYNCTVYWGDTGSSAITAYNDPDLSHVYSSAGSYEIEIQGQFDGISVNNSGTIKTQITDIIDWGDGADFDGFNYMVNAFFGCTNLKSLGTGSILTKSGMSNLSLAFRDCTSLVDVVDSGLFSNCPNVTTVNSCFYNTNITELANGSLRPLTSCTSYNRMLRIAPNAKLNPWMFYNSGEQGTRFLNQSVDFELALAPITYGGAQGTAPDLWNCNFGTGTPTTTNIWGAHNATSLSNWSDIPDDWGGPNTDPITSYADTNLVLGQTGNTVSGYNFGASGGKVWISPTDNFSNPSKVEQTITSYSDTEIEFTAVTAGLDPGTNYLFVEDSGSTPSPDGLSVTVVGVYVYATIVTSDGESNVIGHQVLLT